MRTNLQVPRSSYRYVTVSLACLVLVVGILYWAREVLIPIALAILLTFILAPIVTVLRRRGLGRVLSVVITVALTFAVLGGIATMITVELRGLANELPAYRDNIRKKIADVRLAGKGGPIEKVQNTIQEVAKEINHDATSSTAAEAVPVVVTGGKVDSPSVLPLFGPLIEPLASAGLVVVLVIFMLLRREDLRDRLLRLAGYGRLATTTKAIEEAGKRVSKYLLRQCLLNTGFGTAIGIGLFLIGLPYALLWGFVAAVARFIPYAGPWLAALAPIMMSLAVFASWTAPLLVIGLVLGLELITNLLVEPTLYGQSIGVSEVALLVMIAFWTWLWGPIGLVLAAPLTICVLVVSKSVSDLEFIGLLLNSEPGLEPHHVFYQRLVAKDGDEARDIVQSHLKERSRAELFDQLLIPTLITCRQDYARGRLTEEDQEYLFRTLRQILEEGRNLAPPVNGEQADEDRQAPVLTRLPLVLGVPANDEADELALIMLAEVLSESHWNMMVLPSQKSASETLAEVEAQHPALLCVGLLPPAALSPVRHLCTRLRSRKPELPILVGRWGDKAHGHADQLTGLVQAVGWSVAETEKQVAEFAPIPQSVTPRQANPVLNQREPGQQEQPGERMDSAEAT